MTLIERTIYAALWLKHTNEELSPDCAYIAHKIQSMHSFIHDNFTSEAPSDDLALRYIQSNNSAGHGLRLNKLNDADIKQAKTEIKIAKEFLNAIKAN